MHSSLKISPDWTPELFMAWLAWPGVRHDEHVLFCGLCEDPNGRHSFACVKCKRYISRSSSGKGRWDRLSVFLLSTSRLHLHKTFCQGTTGATQSTASNKFQLICSPQIHHSFLERSHHNDPMSTSTCLG